MYVLTKEKATEFDYTLIIDGSGSMSEPSTRYPGMSKWDEQKETVIGISSFLDTVDDNGIDVILMNGSATVFNNVNTAKVKEIFGERWPSGGTNMAGALEAAVRLHDNQGKNMIVLAFTDGSPSGGTRGQQAVIEVIRAKANKIERDEEFSIQFVQIGHDDGAAEFLKYLDDNLNAKFDIVDTVSVDEAEQMSPIALLEKAIND